MTGQKQVKKPKVHTQRYWKRRLDPPMSKLIRSKGFCEKCGRRGEIKMFDDAHVVGRKNLTLRWDILNHLCLCFQCHRFFWHEEPLEAATWFKQKYPERYQYLLKAKNIVLARFETDYKNLLTAIEEKDFDRLIVPKEALDIS
jgi:hypothetical protein